MASRGDEAGCRDCLATPLSDNRPSRPRPSRGFSGLPPDRDVKHTAKNWVIAVLAGALVLAIAMVGYLLGRGDEGSKLPQPQQRSTPVITGYEAKTIFIPEYEGWKNPGPVPVRSTDSVDALTREGWEVKSNRRACNRGAMLAKLCRHEGVGNPAEIPFGPRSPVGQAIWRGSKVSDAVAKFEWGVEYVLQKAIYEARK